ncbi:MAG TPA: aminopeptidase, partial [Agrobacterium sp.]|nr:aminopeptidase [Agrobacterium sp.]
MPDKRFLSSAFGQEESGATLRSLTRRNLLVGAMGLSAAALLPAG